MKKFLLFCFLITTLCSFGQDTLIVGNDNLTNSATGYPAPYGNYYWAAKHQMLIQSCELVDNGQIIDSIRSLAFDVAQAEGAALKDFTIKIGHTPVSELTTWITGLTTVFFDTSYTETNGWNFHTFSSAFKYNGVDNIVVEVCFQNGQFTDNAITYLSQTQENSCIFFRDDATGVCASTANSGLTNVRPNMALEGSFTTIANDIAAVGLVSPASLCGLGSNEIIGVEIFNAGNTAVTGFNVSYSINGGTVVTETFNASIASDTTGQYLFNTTGDLSAAQSDLKIWVTLIGDQVICNDTLELEIINSTSITAFPYIEDFDNNGGFLTDLTSDSIDWDLNSGSTTSSATGPSGDHTTDTTNYLYVEASSPNSPDKLAVIEGPCMKIDTLNNPYLEFWYHMWGGDMGTLSVEISDGLNWVKAWERSGDQTNIWKKGKVFINNFTSDANVKYRFVGVTGAGYESDIAIDDIVVYDAPTQHDLGVTAIFNVDTGFLCMGSNMDTVWAEVMNCGTFEEQTYDVAWSLNGGAVSSVTVNDTLMAGGSAMIDLNSTIGLSGAGSYTLKVWTSISNDAVAANDTLTYNFTILPVPSSNIPNSNICMNDTVTFDAGPGFNNYYWEALGEVVFGYSQTFDVNFEDSIIVELTDTFGCFGVDTFVTSFLSLPNVDLGNDTTVCSGALVTLDAGTFVSYLWPDGTTLQTFDFTSIPAVDTVITVEVTDGNGCKNTDDIRLVFIDTLSIDLGVDTIVCPGYVLDAGVGNGTYLWSTTETTQMISVTSSGTYFVDINKCGTTSDTINITVNIPPSFEIGIDTTVCADDSILLDATVNGPYWYNWDNGDTTATSYVSKYCNYSLDMFDSYGDSWNGGSIDFIVNGVIEGNYTASGFFSNAQPSVAQGDSVSIIYNPGGFETENSFDLYDPSGNLVYSDGPSPTGGLVWSSLANCFNNGYFGVNIVDTILGCMARDTIMIDFSSPTVDLGNDTGICAGSMITFSAGAATSYLWSTTSTNQSVTVGALGQYWVQATDSVGCVASDTVEITANYPTPSINLGNDTTICAADNISLGVPSSFSSVLWSDNSTSNTVFANAATWWVQVTDSNACSGSDTIVISSLPVVNVNIGSDTTLCPGDTLVVDAGTGFSNYQWSHGFLTQTAPIGATGTYWVDVTDSIGCGGSDTINVTVLTINLNVDLGNDTTICDGDSLLLDASVGASSLFTYSWNNTATTSSIVVGSTGNYNVTVNACGLSDQDSIQVTVSNNPTIDLGNDTTICSTASLTLDAGSGFSNYAWSNLANTQTITVTTAGNYGVTVTNAAGCSGSDAMVLTVDTCVGITEFNSLDLLDFEIFPNPTTQDEISLQINSKLNVDAFNIEVISLSGQLIKTMRVSNQWGEYIVNVKLGGLANGMYQVNIISQEARITKRLLIQ
jgi:hypothetical protein